MLRISALALLIALGASVHVASAGSFGADIPHITFASDTRTSPTTPDLPTRACTAPTQTGADACALQK